MTQIISAVSDTLARRASREKGRLMRTARGQLHERAHSAAAFMASPAVVRAGAVLMVGPLRYPIDPLEVARVFSAAARLSRTGYQFEETDLWAMQSCVKGASYVGVQIKARKYGTPVQIYGTRWVAMKKAVTKAKQETDT